MYDNLLNLVNNGDWLGAVRELNKVIKVATFDETLAVLAATVFINIGDYKTARKMVGKGLLVAPHNCELWMLLAQIYEQKNVNQAYLCYENALFYAEEETDRDVICQFMEALVEGAEITVKKTAIVVLSYNSLQYTQECIESIRKTCPDSAYELIVIDNASKDASPAWLEQQPGMKILLNTENMGFPKGCNQGIELAESDSDIFLLNNDTILCENSLFWLRMGLYENDNVGATGSVSNYVSNGQYAGIKGDTVEDLVNKGNINNLLIDAPLVEKIYLVGFALLIKRSALEKVGYLDERFTPGTYEDNDMGLKLRNAGYSVCLCKNSFIFHYGSGNGKNLHKWNNQYSKNEEKLNDKWQFATSSYLYPNAGLAERVGVSEKKKISVLEIGCGLGATLLEIRNRIPEAQIYGIENDSRLYSIVSQYIECQTISDLTRALPYEEHFFDYILADNLMGNNSDIFAVIANLENYLAPEGEIINPLYKVYKMKKDFIIKPSFDTKYYQGSDTYSDGDIENVILDIVSNNAPENYDQAITDRFSWETYYHLTGIRKNILNWYPFEEDSEVLEIGCGMGAITSVLCDRCKSVTSVELSLRRATSTLVRCRERDNLNVIVGNLNDIQFEKKYDYITVIGVLEYQGRYTDGENPYRDFIVKLKQLLKPNGKLLIAIENQYGLKYWNGALEDHTGIPFNGMNQYGFTGKGVRTFSRKGLEKLVKEAGFENTYFYYPMPDYKLPEKVFSDEFLPKAEDLKSINYYYLDKKAVVADERVLYPDIIENGTFPFFANSFLVECSDAEDLGRVVFSSTTPIRKREKAIQTIIGRDKNGKYVEKVPLYKEADSFINQILENESILEKAGKNVVRSERTAYGIRQEYHKGQLFDTVLKELYVKKNIDAIFEKWDILYSSLCETITDTVPRNAFFENNQIIWFDQEWSDSNADLKFAMFRALLVFYVNYTYAETVVPFDDMLKKYDILDRKQEFIERENLFYGDVFSPLLMQHVNAFGVGKIEKDISTNVTKLMKVNATVEKNINHKEYDKQENDVRKVTYNEIADRLYTPTFFEKIDGYYFIVDCWHNRVIYSDMLKPIGEWKVLDNQLKHPHSICKLGDFYLVEDTERDKVIFYRKDTDKFERVYELNAKGRPHRLIKGPEENVVLCLLSTAQQIMEIRLKDSEILTNTYVVDNMASYPYIRSIRLINGFLWCATANRMVLVLDPENLYSVVKRFNLSKDCYGLNDVVFYEGNIFVSVYTDESGAIKPRLLCCDSLENGKVEDVYAKFGLKGVPYYFSVIDGRLFMPEIDTYSRISAFNVENGRLNQEVLYDFGAPTAADMAYKNSKC